MLAFQQVVKHIYIEGETKLSDKIFRSKTFIRIGFLRKWVYLYELSKRMYKMYQQP